MSYICNLSFAQRIFPEQLGTAAVSCLHKKDNWTLLDNYRAISLLVSFGKILEKCATIQLTNYFISNNLITPAQFGFIPGKSTLDALQRTVDNIYSAFDDSMVSVGICLDLTKAFDSLDRRILCRKLEFYGVTGQSLAWFHSYLARRKQHVRYNKLIYCLRLVIIIMVFLKEGVFRHFFFSFSLMIFVIQPAGPILYLTPTIPICLWTAEVLKTPWGLLAIA